MRNLRSISIRTQAQYGRMVGEFNKWCDAAGIPLPPDVSTIKTYIRHLSSIRAAGSIEVAHHALMRTYPNARRKSVRDEVQDLVVMRPPRPKRAITRIELACVIERLSEENPCRFLRNRALVSLLAEVALKSAALSMLDIENVRFVSDSCFISVDGQPEIEVWENDVTSPVSYLKAWIYCLEDADPQICTGPIFRGIDRHGTISSSRMPDRTLRLIFKRCLAQAGMDEREYSLVSARKGFHFRKIYGHVKEAHSGAEAAVS